MRIAMLGPLEVTDDTGHELAVVGSRLQAVLARLALEPGRLVTVGALVDGVWGDKPPAGAVNALQSLVSRLRRVVGGAVESLPTGYRLTIPPAHVDVHEFERLAAEGRRSGDAELLRAALALWRGPALSGLPELAPQAVRLDEARLAAVEDRIDADLALHRHLDVLAELAELAGAHPLRERPHRQLVTALYAADRPAEALTAYETYRRAVRDQLGSDPSAEFRTLHLAILNDDRSVLAAEPRTNLRAQLTTFVGRTVEIEELPRLLAGARLVTLVGAGGAGKTRLATEIGSRVAPSTPDGVWLVELAPVRDPGQLAGAILGTLGVSEASVLAEGAPGPAPESRLIAALTGKRLLLLLDNCEHLIDAAAHLVEALLGQCPDVRVLATSREPLGITGETLRAVPPLELPPAGPVPDPLAYPAVRLFADRAAAVRQDFAVTPANAAAVIEVCRRLDGMPMAIELAAARLRAMPVEQVASRLSDRFRLLTGGSRTALPRHQTLQAVVDWSWDLLTEPERTLARRLSVFAGGATLEGAEQVCAGGVVPLRDVMALLAALVDKSLLEVVEAHGTRYRMLETVRLYSAERLAESGEAGRVRAAHADYYCRLAETADRQLRSADQVAWMDRLAAEHDDITAALHWAVDSGAALVAMRLVTNLGWYWSLRGRHQEATGWLRAAIDLPGEVPPEIRVGALTLLAVHARTHDADARAVLAEALALDAELPVDGEVPPILALLRPISALLDDDPERAEAGLVRAEESTDGWVRATAILMRALIVDNSGEATAAEGHFTAALAAYQEQGDRWGMAMAVSALAELRSLRGDRDGSIQALSEAVELVRTLGAEDDEPQLLARLAAQRCWAGDLDGARADLDRAVALCRRVGMPAIAVFAEAGFAEVARRDGDLTEARVRYEKAMASATTYASGPPQVWAVFYSGYARVLVGQGDVPAAENYARKAVAAGLEAKDMPIVGMSLNVLAGVRLAAGEPLQCAKLLGLASVIRGITDNGDPDVLATRAGARAALDPDTYEAAVAAAGALDRDDARLEAEWLAADGFVGGSGLNWSMVPPDGDA